MKLKLILLLALALLTSIPATRAAESVSVLLQKGIFAEETEGDLDAAMKIYQQILAEAESNKPPVAQAQLRLGLCQVKMGQSAAAAVTFRKLIQRFPEQSELTARAHAELERLGEVSVAPVVTTIVSGAGSVAEGLLSPDESRIAFVKWGSGKKDDLFVKDLETGVLTAVTKSDYGAADVYEFADFNFQNGGPGAWSRDSQWLAYIWYTKNGDTMQTRVARADGSATRVIYPNGLFSPYDWSPDGRTLVGELREEDHPDRYLALLAVETGEVIAKLEPLDHPRFSPDGRWIIGSTRANGNSDLFVVNVWTKERSRIISFLTEEAKPVFSADGAHVFFSSDRRGTWDLWAMPIAEGRPGGEPFVIKPDFGDHPKRVTNSGKLCFNTYVQNREIFSVSLDTQDPPGEAKLRPIARFNIGSHTEPCWSPDGKRIAARHGENRICIHDRETGHEEIIDPGVRSFIKLEWSPTGDRFAFSSGSDPNGPRTYLYSRTHRKVSKLPNHPDGMGYRGVFSFSRDGKQFFRSLVGPVVGLVATHVETGVHRITQFPEITTPVEWILAGVSPDERQFAFESKDRRSLMVFDSAEKTSRTLEVADRAEQRFTTSPRWSPDSQWIAYYLIYEGKGPTLMVASADGKTKRALVSGKRIADAWYRPPQWSPDGSELCFAAVEADPIRQIALIGNLPGAHKSATASGRPATTPAN